MTIEYTKNGKNIGKMQGELTALIEEYSKTKDPETGKKMLKLHEEMTEYKPNCGLCRAGRDLFKKSLVQIKSGNVIEGLASMKGSMTTVNIKWGIIMDKLKS